MRARRCEIASQRPDETDALPCDGREAVAGLPWAWGPPPVGGCLREHVTDFRVDEELGFAPTGTGEHLLLRIRKRGTNTQWVARQLAQLAGVRPSDVGYAGLKDRWAETSQWFSVHLPGRTAPDWGALGGGQVEVLETARHHRKLRRGALRGNRFRLVVRQLRGDADALEARLRAVAGGGVPNYFGEQRFGRHGRNLERARALFAGELGAKDRHQRGLYLSAARSYLFNRVLARRVQAGTWSEPIAGDVLMLDGTHSIFAAEDVTDALIRRAAALDVHPTGPLWGRGDPPCRGEALALERIALNGCGLWLAGLEQAGMKQERRALRVAVRGLAWDWLDGGTLELRFRLPRGAYATGVLRELVDTMPGQGA